MKTRTLLCFLVVLFCAAAAYPQVKVKLVDPAATASALKAIHSPHMVMTPESAADLHQLLLMIPGTGGHAVDFRTFDSCFAAMGYHVISLDYPNNVITTVCSKSEDSTCFDHFRQEIVFGTPVSDKVAVDSVNCIVSRFRHLLVCLAKEDKQWQEYVQNGQPRWDKITVAGHSQGAGHAAFLGKHFTVHRVMMFSGPQDYMQLFHAPARWQFLSGRTPVNRYYAFLHLKDPFNYEYQAADVSAVTQFAVTDTAMVHPGIPVHKRKHILVTDIDKNDKHGSTLRLEFIPVWRYMIGAPAAH
ncbi:hypothetical protein [Chitinophaga sp. 212800010-3]|uniref:BPSS1187 family protein n=1 Tax=unclassified Chitinophaga TaxID=2619133 RepID=UPI002DE6FC94|nr:Alpha/beta hydrolase [Chitinophaga sp. 212800010-3]